MKMKIMSKTSLSSLKKRSRMMKGKWQNVAHLETMDTITLIKK